MKTKKNPPEVKNKPKEIEDNVVISAFETYEHFVDSTTSNWVNLARAVDYIEKTQSGETEVNKDALKAKQAIANELLDGLERIQFYFSLMAGIPIISDEENPKVLQIEID